MMLVGRTHFLAIPVAAPEDSVSIMAVHQMSWGFRWWWILSSISAALIVMPFIVLVHGVGSPRRNEGCVDKGSRNSSPHGRGSSMFGIFTLQEGRGERTAEQFITFPAMWLFWL